MDAREVLAGLNGSATRLAAVRAPAKAGVYAWFVDDPTTLPLLPDQGDDPIYVGLSKNLAQRGDETHFKSGRTGFSTLRRSLGALLEGDLNLRVVPRGTGPSEQNFRCYRFDDAGETRLTRWMQEHLRIGVMAYPSPEAIERELIALARPPLNLTGWSNPHAVELKALRKRCADKARSAYAGRPG